MKRQMKFQTRLMLTYSLFISILLFILGVSFYLYNSHLFEQNTQNNLSQLAVKTSEQLDACIKEMDNLSVEVIADKDISNALVDLSISNSTYTEADFMRLSDNLAKAVALKTISKSNIYRVSIFNKKGYFISSSPYDERSDSILDHIKNLTWVKSARISNGSKFLVLPHKDDWVSNNPPLVFSLVRLIKDPGYEIGIVEIQQKIEKLGEITSIKGSSSINVMILNEMGQVVYSNGDDSPETVNCYIDVISSGENQTLQTTNPDSKVSELLSYKFSNYTNWTVIISQNKADLISPLVFMKNMTFIIGFSIIVITLFSFYLSAKKLTRPLRELRGTIEQMNIDTLPGQMPIRHENNEIQALNISFQKMRERLNIAIEQEIQARELQIKAHFDALQAQINPHFLYNSLGVIANMGDEAECSEISVTCRSLAKMLRYSISNQKAEATLNEEVENAANYLNLMKKRYEHRFSYDIELDEAIANIIIPKLTIQPLVENSLSHGFDNYSGTMKTVIKCSMEQSNWQVQVTDNGSGFEQEMLENLQDKIDQYSKNFFSRGQSLELSIGGMGLISTFARLKMLFGDTLKFELKNNMDGGACITISGPLPNVEAKEEVKYV